jgi:hypothetical protein
VKSKSAKSRFDDLMRAVVKVKPEKKNRSHAGKTVKKEAVGNHG